MLRPLILAIRQVADPAFRRPLLLGAGLALALGLALAAGVSWGLGWLAGGEGWLASLAAAAGGLLSLFVLWWLFVPVLLAIASIFTDGVAAAVERRHYPALPPPAGASAAEQAWAGILLAMQMAALTLVLLPLSLLIPVIGAVALWAAAAIGLGEGLFQGVAMRRMSPAAAKARARALRWQIWGIGGVFALLAVVSPLNLLVPVLGTAAMVHVLHRNTV